MYIKKSNFAIIFLVLYTMLFFLFSSCSKSVNIEPDKRYDTLYSVYTITYNKPEKTIYYWIDIENGIADTIYSEVCPKRYDTIADDFNTHVTWINIDNNVFKIFVSMICLTSSSFKDDTSSNDTIFINDTIYNVTYKNDTVFIPVTQKIFENFIKNNGPYFCNKDSIKINLDTLQEGYYLSVTPEAKHFYNDCTKMYLGDSPDFIKIESGNIYKEPYDFYNDTLNNTIFIKFFNKQTITCAPDSLYVNKTYEWKLYLENKFGLKDSIEITTFIKPY